MIYPPLIEAGIFPTEINCSSPPHLSREQSIIHMRFTGKKTASRMYCGMCLPDLCVTISDSCGSSGTSRRGSIYLSGKDSRFYKRGIDQYPARLSIGLQSPIEINAQLHNAPQEHCYVCIGTRGCALDSVWKISAYADPNPAPILASEN